MATKPDREKKISKVQSEPASIQMTFHRRIAVHATALVDAQSRPATCTSPSSCFIAEKTIHPLNPDQFKIMYEAYPVFQPVSFIDMPDPVTGKHPAVKTISRPEFSPVFAVFYPAHDPCLWLLFGREKASLAFVPCPEICHTCSTVYSAGGNKCSFELYRRYYHDIV
jgi:hypothetical protein